ncbi:hypothetical protein [Nocardiopsis sp. CA-288880]|uniref:hypothetical protein n=1 Tax=Nocardiopsis sp. CA-288880 TaxID=3239995 RepID=UPI003D986BF5
MVDSQGRITTQIDHQTHDTPALAARRLQDAGLLPLGTIAVLGPTPHPAGAGFLLTLDHVAEPTTTATTVTLTPTPAEDGTVLGETEPLAHGDSVLDLSHSLQAAGVLPEGRVFTQKVPGAEPGKPLSHRVTDTPRNRR